MGAHERGEGGRQPAPSQLAGGCPGMGGYGKPDKAPQAGLRGQLFGPEPLCRFATSPRAAGSHPTAWGAFLRGQSPREKPPLSKGGAERKRGGGIPGRLRG